MNMRPSTVTTTDDGWTWLSPNRRGARLRQALWSVVFSVLLIALAAAATVPPRLVAVPLVAVILGAGMLLVRTLWNRAHSAVAVSSLGVAVRSGFDVAQIAWPAVEAVLVTDEGRRVRVVVEARGARHWTAATFSRDAAMAWLQACIEHAGRRHMRPEPLDGVAGFRTS